jgi:hypothetical protein
MRSNPFPFLLYSITSYSRVDRLHDLSWGNRRASRPDTEKDSSCGFHCIHMFFRAEPSCFASVFTNLQRYPVAIVKSRVSVLAIVLTLLLSGTLLPLWTVTHRRILPSLVVAQVSAAKAAKESKKGAAKKSKKGTSPANSPSIPPSEPDCIEVDEGSRWEGKYYPFNDGRQSGYSNGNYCFIRIGPPYFWGLYPSCESRFTGYFYGSKSDIFESEWIGFGDNAPWAETVYPRGCR